MPYNSRPKNISNGQNINFRSDSELLHQNENQKVRKRKINTEDQENVKVKRLRQDKSNLSFSDLDGADEVTKFSGVNDQMTQSINIDEANKSKSKFVKSITAGSNDSKFRDFLDTKKRQRHVQCSV